jgi:hypothetical protein
MEYKAQCGDIFLCDSDRLGAKIVKFFMQSPTVYQQIWRWMNGKLQPVRYYHTGMILDSQVMIEQQGTVKYGETQKILSRRITIYRMKNLSFDDKELLKNRAIVQLGQGYGVEDVIAHTATWLTGIRQFTRVVGALSRNRDICVNRVARWYNHICNFGTNWYEITTKMMDEYCSNHPEEWEVVYQN